MARNIEQEIAQAIRDAEARGFQRGQRSSLDRTALDRMGVDMANPIAGADVNPLVGADGPPPGTQQASTGTYMANPLNSTLRPLVAAVANGSAFNANIFYWDDLMAPNITVTVAQGPPVSATAAQTAPTWLTSSYAEYREALYYFNKNPSYCEFVYVQSSETGTAPVLSSGNIIKKKSNPFGLVEQNTVPFQSFLLNTQYQAQRIQVPIAYPLDLLHWYNLTSATNSSGSTVSFTLTFFVSLRNEPFRQLNTSQAAGNRMSLPKLT